MCLFATATFNVENIFDVTPREHKIEKTGYLRIIDLEISKNTERYIVCTVRLSVIL